MGQVEARVAVNSGSTCVFGFSSAFSPFSKVRSLTGRSGFVSAFRRIELARDRIPDDRIQPGHDIQMTTRMLRSRQRAECWSNADKSTKRREYCQHCERNPHRRGGLVRYVRAVMFAMTVSRDVMRHVFVYWSNVFAGLVSRAISGGGERSVVLRQAFVVSRSVCFVSLATGWRFEEFLLAPERHRHQSRHVKSGTRGGNRADQPDDPAERNVRRRCCVPEYFVFGPETAERNDAADREPSGHERPVRVRHVLLQTTHAPHVLLVVHAVNDAARAEEHERFEERVRHYVEDADPERAHAAGHEHEAELRNG